MPKMMFIAKMPKPQDMKADVTVLHLKDGEPVPEVIVPVEPDEPKDGAPAEEKKPVKPS